MLPVSGVLSHQRVGFLAFRSPEDLGTQMLSSAEKPW